MNQTKSKKKRKNLYIAGKIITLLQLLASVVLSILLFESGVLPNKYLTIVALGLLLLFLLTHICQYFGSRFAAWIGILFSLLLTFLILMACAYFLKVRQTMDNVGGATYKTDNMIVVVKKDDPAENLLDAKDYRFGSQTEVDQENTKKMLKDVTSVIGKDPELTEYTSLQEEAQALLDGDIEAAIYNEGFSGIIEDSIEGYADQVRVLYQYGIDTQIEQESADIDQPFHIYISGIDVSGPITTNSRSDVNIIMTVNPKTKKILLTTTPRDYYVEIPGISGGARDKLTHAGIYGVDASMATLEEIYGIDISYYARVNFTSLIKIVDALGGVDVESAYSFEAGGYTFKEGKNHLEGEAALAFSRERHSFQDGDNQRGKNQEAVLTAILKKAMSPAILGNASELMNSVSDSVETNMSYSDMAKFINMQLDDRSDWSIESVAATGRGDTQTCYSSGSMQLYVMWPDETSVEEIRTKIQEVTGEE